MRLSLSTSLPHWWLSYNKLFYLSLLLPVPPSQLSARTHSQMHTNAHTRTHTHTHTHTRANARKHTRTLTHARSLSISLFFHTHSPPPPLHRSFCLTRSQPWHQPHLHSSRWPTYSLGAQWAPCWHCSTPLWVQHIISTHTCLYLYTRISNTHCG